MSKFVGIFRKQRGKVGDFVFRKQGNEYIVSEKPPKKGTSEGTRNQAMYRAQWGNLVRFWQSFGDRDKPSFEAATINVSHFNLFMRANINGSRVYLSKENVRLGACVVAPYRVSLGSLSTIGVEAPQSGVFVTSIGLGSLVLDANTTIAAFSQNVLDYNQDFEPGDQISVFVAMQIVDASLGIPRCVMSAYKIELKTDDSETLLRQVIPANVGIVSDGMFAIQTVGDAGVAVVKSRKTADGLTLVSTQSFVVNNSILSQYNNVDARLKAAESYGIIDRGDWLTPNGENEIAAI